MALAEAILVCLAEKPLTGYDLAKFFQTSIGFFWKADHQLIYRELKRLKTAGLICSEQVIQHDRPNKTLNALTDKGRQHLRDWSAEPAPAPSIKDDLAVRLYALADTDIAGFRRQLAARLDYHRRQLALYHFLKESHFKTLRTGDVTQRGRYLGLMLGIRYEQMWADWCAYALEEIAHVRDSEPA